MLTIISSYLAACTASFALAAAERTIEEKKWWGAERSKCAVCKKTLGAFDLFPIFSYLLLGGKCRHCGAKIPAECLTAELAGAFCGAFFALRFGLSPALILCHTAFLFLLFSTVTDLKNGYVYDACAFTMAAAGLAERFIFGGINAVTDGIIGAAAGFLLLFAIYLFSRKKGMGLGDAYFMTGYGAVFGWKMALLGLYCSFLAGGVYAVALLITKKATRKTSLPLIPFIFAGTMIALAIYPQLFAWFMTSADTPF